MPRKRSWVWNHCTKSNDGLTAICNICNEEFNVKGSTSSLNKHLRNVHEFSDVKMKRQKLSDNDMDTENQSLEATIDDQFSDHTADSMGNFIACGMNLDESETSLDLPNTSTATDDFQTSTPARNSRRIIKAKRIKNIVPCNRTRTENIHQALSKLIVMNMLSLAFVESDGFKNFMAVVEPGYKVPCKETIQKRIDLLYNLTKEKVIKELETASSVVAVSDCWSSRAQDAYLTVSAHFITDTWQPKCICLATQEADERHTAENLCIRMTEIINDYGLQNKITTVVTDNATNAVQSVELMECNDENFDIQCAAHTLQLAVNEGIKLQGIKNLCSKASKMVGHFKHSNVACYALENKQQQLGLKQLKLVQNCPTRWNSTYFMIERLIINRPAIQAVLADRKVMKAQIAAKLDICEMEWKQLEDIADTLKPLELTTTVLCAENSSISLVRPLIRTLIDNHLQDIEGEQTINDFRCKIRDSLEARFRMKFETTISPRQIASFLDPRYKNLDAEDAPSKLLIRETVRQKLSSVETMSFDNTEPKQSALDLLFKNTVSIQRNSTADQFQRYLSEPSISYNLCLYDWWRSHAETYPSFVPLVKKYLAIPATSSASERVFSTAGNVVTIKRSSLDPENVEKLIFLYQNRSYLE